MATQVILVKEKTVQPYDKDIVAWANEQAQLLRARRFDLLDIEHIAEEIEDVGKSEQRELANRMAKLLRTALNGSFSLAVKVQAGNVPSNQQL